MPYAPDRSGRWSLDPAVLETPFGANVDIRDTVNYREVMKQYALGPNGGILTSLNLFATRFEQVAHTHTRTHAHAHTHTRTRAHARTHSHTHQHTGHIPTSACVCAWSRCSA